MTNDHDHDLCAKLACPRCGWDESSHQHVISFSDSRYSCSMCEDCWMTYQAEMDPADRDPFVINEMAEP